MAEQIAVEPRRGAGTEEREPLNLGAFSNDNRILFRSYYLANGSPGGAQYVGIADIFPPRRG